MLGKRTLALAGITALFLVAALFVFYFPPGGTGSSSNDDKFANAMRLVERACLSNVSEKTRASVIASLKALSGSINAEGGVEREDTLVAGASKDLKDIFQIEENQKIRDCIEPYFQKLFDDLLASAPDTLDYRFDLKKSVNAAESGNDKTAVLYMNAGTRYIDGHSIAIQRAGYYSTFLPYPGTGDTFTGTLALEVYSEAIVSEPARPYAVCLRRPDPMPKLEQSFVHLTCEEGAACRLKAFTPPWVQTCDQADTASSAWKFELIKTAQAQKSKEFWVIPSAATLQNIGDELEGIGHILFEIQTNIFQNSGADAIEVSLSVNGQRVLEDGLKAKYRPAPYEDSEPFRYQFGFQNLNFQGLYYGCDIISLTMRPLGRDISEMPTVTVSNYQVALRDSPQTTIRAGSGMLDWSGSYHRPVNEFDNEVFIQSIIYSQESNPESFTADTLAFSAARRDIAGMKEKFDALQLEFESSLLVSVIRPPLTKPSFGLAVGKTLPTGQIQFTFPYTESRRIWDHLMQVRGEDATIARAIRSDSFIYSIASNAERKNAPVPPGICRAI